MMDDKHEVIPIQATHLPLVAEVHSRAFADSALTRLGFEAVRRYYEWQLVGPHDHCFVGAYGQNSLLGFAVGGKSRGALAGFVSRNSWYLTTRVLLQPRLIFSNRVRKALVSAGRAVFRMRARSQAAAARGVETVCSFGILAIAVDPPQQGKGIGVQLMEHLEQVARERRFMRMHLHVSVNNAQAIRFYEKVGWTRGRDGEIWSGLMERQLS